MTGLTLWRATEPPPKEWTSNVAIIAYEGATPEEVVRRQNVAMVRPDDPFHILYAVRNSRNGAWEIQLCMPPDPTRPCIWTGGVTEHEDDDAEPTGDCPCGIARADCEYHR